MRFAQWSSCALVCVLALLAAPAALGGVPPNPHDPCVTGVRNTCNTTGVGFYRTFRYGTRWFGDFRNAIPGTTHTFCIDLRFWYPGADYRYREDTSGGNLGNKEGEAVPLPNQQRIAYAIWVFGRSSDPNQQAAVMLYVHGQMGDARPGEVDPRVVGPAVSSIYDRIDRDATRYHGPYRIETKLPAGLKVSKPATATIRVLAASGTALPNLQLTLGAQGATGVPKQVQTGDGGVARVTLTPTGAPLRLSVTTAALPSTLPRIFQPTSPSATINGQRLVLPSSQVLTDAATGNATKTQIQVSTAAKPAVLAAGESSTDGVTIASAGAGWQGTVQVRVYGPFRTTAAIVCTGTPAAQGTFSAKGNGAYTTTTFKPTLPGWYVYQEVVPGDAGTTGLTTPCDPPAERFRVEVKPKVSTTVSAQSVAPGTAITDRVQVSGLAGEHATVQAALYGPFATRAAIRCTGTPVWTGSLDVTADGVYTTQPFTPTVPGYYTYREAIAAAGLVRATQTACADTAETTIVIAKPAVATQVSTQRVSPGATVTDKAVVTGLGGLQAGVEVELWGPFAAPAAIRCSGTPYWRGSFVAKGDGTYTTAPVKLQQAGYYTYRESIAGTPAYAAFTAPCGETTETTFVHADPILTTVVSDEVVRPGAKLSDHIRVQRLGGTAATIKVELYGPFANRAAIGCTGSPAGRGEVKVKGDGVVTSPGMIAGKAGFYVFRERLTGSPLVKEVDTGCGQESEVSLVAPLIITGRGDRTREIRARGAAALTPARVQLGAVGIDAPVAAVGIDLARGVLGVSPDIHHTGWWQDGAQPGDRTGAILIAGHVDSATAGAGSFFRLRRAPVGAKIELTAGGRTFSYRVVSVRSYVKTALPTSVWSRRGPARLVLVTCGGPFDPVTRHYRDNIVVTAVPA